MKRSKALMCTVLAVGALLVLGGCHYDSASYHYDYYDAGPDGYHTGYVITETPKRPRVRRHYSTGYSVGYHTGYHTTGHVTIGHTRHYGYSDCHTGYRHGGYHVGYHHRPRYRSHGHGYIHFGGHHGGYHCD